MTSNPATGEFASRRVVRKDLLESALSTDDSCGLSADRDSGLSVRPTVVGSSESVEITGVTPICCAVRVLSGMPDSTDGRMSVGGGGGGAGGGWGNYSV